MTNATAYTCPMHPEVQRDRPGMCPECGMNLIPAKGVEHAHHDKHEGHSTNDFLRKFWVSLVLTVPLLAYSELPEKAFGWLAPRFPGWELVMLLLGSLVYFFCGAVFLQGAWRELRARLPGMMTLIALAITSAYSFSVYAVLAGREHTLFWELSTLIAVMLLGHFIEMRAVSGAQGALKELTKLLPDRAEVIRGGETKHIPLAELALGDLVLVRPGGKVPADGKIVEGASELNEAIITGESKSVPKKEGDGVIAGSINGDGVLRIQITQIGEHTFLAGVMRLVADAQASKSRLQLLSDRAASYLTFLAVVAGAATFAFWISAGKDVVFAVGRLVAVLVIACPHALGLAIPLVASISTTKAARNGLLIRDRLSLEAARTIDTVLFDKTGTLTKGEFGVDEVVSVDGKTKDEVLLLAASLNAQSEHPLAKAMVKEAFGRNLTLLPVSDMSRVSSGGIKASLNGAHVAVGNDRILAEYGILFPDKHVAKVLELATEGKTVVHVVTDKNLVGSIALVDVIREESREAVAALKKMGIKSAMITGDSEDVARWVAGEIGLDEYFAKVLPHEKSEKVKMLQSKGQKVAMVGDGVNDAPALTQADLGIAIGAGTNVAIESAGIILVKSDPRDIPKIVTLSRLTYRKMLQNLFWATAYNVVALPVAAGVLFSRGIVLEPAVAAVFMSLSTVIVAGNAVLLRSQKI